MAARKKVGRAGTRKSTAKKATKVEAAAAAPAGPAPRKATRKGGASAKGAKSAQGKGSATTRGDARTRTAPGKAKAAAAKAASAPVVSAFPEIEELAGLMDRFDLLEVRYSSDGDGATKIHVSRRGSGAPAVQHAPIPTSAPAAPAAAPATPAAPVEVAPAVDEMLVPFKSPMVGTFYRAPSPEAPPFGSVGDKVDPSSVVCIIEAMKVMNEIMPDVSGEIVSIEVENGEAVEFGQTLMLLRPR